MRALAGRITVLVVEHAMDVVLSISDHIVVMHQGRLLAQGTPEVIRANAQVQEAYLGGQYAVV
jgi:branched-chain amino acid transport system ATP-binding protein